MTPQSGRWVQKRKEDNVYNKDGFVEMLKAKFGLNIEESVKRVSVPKNEPKTKIKSATKAIKTKAVKVRVTQKRPPKV